MKKGNITRAVEEAIRGWIRKNRRLASEGIAVNICEIRPYMGSVDIEGEIVDMNAFMLALNDRTGQIFVRYYQKYGPTEEQKKLKANLKIGNIVKITNCQVVNYHGIIQLRLTRKGEVSLKPKTEI